MVGCRRGESDRLTAQWAWIPDRVHARQLCGNGHDNRTSKAMKLTDKIELFRMLWNDIQDELLRAGGADERINEASDDITFAVGSLPYYLGGK